MIETKPGQYIMDKYPFLYRYEKWPMSHSTMYWGIAVGPGWHPIMDMLSATLDQYIKETYPWYKIAYYKLQFKLSSIVNKIFPKLKWYPENGPAMHQVKVKWGSLTIYTTGLNGANDYIRAAERLSSVTCDVCGNTNYFVNRMGWMMQACRMCAEEKKKGA